MPATTTVRLLMSWSLTQSNSPPGHSLANGESAAGWGLGLGDHWEPRSFAQVWTKIKTSTVFCTRMVTTTCVREFIFRWDLHTEKKKKKKPLCWAESCKTTTLHRDTSWPGHGLPLYKKAIGLHQANSNLTGGQQLYTPGCTTCQPQWNTREKETGPLSPPTLTHHTTTCM